MPDFRLFAHLPEPDDARIEAATAAGASAVIVPLGGAFDGEVGSYADTGVALIAEIELDRWPREHETVVHEPALFSIQRDGSARGRLDDGEGGQRLVPVLAERLRGLLDEGAAGFRLAGVERIAPAVVAALAAAVRETFPTAVFLAGPLGEARGHAAALGAAGLDGLVTSIGYWDLAAPWFYDEIAALRGAAPLIAEVRADQLLGVDEPNAIARKLLVAAASAGGLILPAGVFGDPGLIARVRKIGERAAGFDGELRRLSGSGAPVTALLRADAADVRRADEALIVLVNTTAREAAAPDPATILPGAGFALRGLTRVGRGDPFAPLVGGEVRLVTAKRGKPVALPRPDPRAARTVAADWPRLVIEKVTPVVEGGPFPVKRTVGERVAVEALVYADGHEQLAAEIHWRAADDRDWQRVRMAQFPNDLWTGDFVLPRLGRHEFFVEGWLDVFGGFRRDFAKKLDAGVAQPVDHDEGRVLVRQAGLADWAGRLDAAAADGEALAALLLSPELAAAMDAADPRPFRTRSPVQVVDAERLAARFSSWYEVFPRSLGTDGRHGTLRDVIDHLPRVRAMGFDTLYFPPIHPIGRTNRKGPNNTLTPAEGDPGSPYAIGSADGGHEALHPELGTFEDFRALVDAARGQGLEIAIDFAIQCSPDHPWLKDHAGWFAWRPDGSMKYAENPPKKYQDIVNVDFYGPDAVPGLWTALRDVVLLWCQHGVKTFRVDNPHTKPLSFWQWMIGEVRAKHPDAIFLAEAFTRPAMMYRLAKIGFSQSYTYFTWRNEKQELIDYIEELTTQAPKEFYRPHFFVNTPDINPIFLQTSGRPGFRIRAVLAATLSGLFGVYSGFELCDGTPLPGKEEYLDSEKFELRPRDWQAEPNIIADITLFNQLRRAHPALQTHLGTRFYPADNERIVFYGKSETGGTGMILVMVSLDPHGAQDCTFELPLWEMGLPDDAGIQVEDLAGGYRFEWYGKTQTIRLEPDEPYRIWRVAPWGTL